MARHSSGLGTLPFVVLAGLLGCQAAPDGRAAAGPAATTVELLREIGCVDCEGPSLFGSIAGVAAHGDTIIVVTRERPHVRVFAPGGTSAFGETGSGPGELRLPAGAAVVNDSLLVVADEALASLSVFLVDGTFLTSQGAGVGASLTFATSPAGRWAMQLVTAGRLGPQVELLDARLERRGVFRVPSSMMSGPGDTTQASLNPFVVGHAVSDDGRVALGYGWGPYRVDVYDLEGRKIGDITRDVERPRRSEQELTALADAMSEVPAGGGAAPGTPSDDKPHFDMASFRFDLSGRLWIRSNRGAPGHTAFDVYDAQYAYLGQVDVPRHVLHFAFAGERLLTAHVGENDVPRVGIWSSHF